MWFYIFQFKILDVVRLFKWHSYIFQILIVMLLSRFATLLHQCIGSIKRGSAKEVALAAHAIGNP